MDYSIQLAQSHCRAQSSLITSNPNTCHELSQKFASLIYEIKALLNEQNGFHQAFSMFEQKVLDGSITIEERGLCTFFASALTENHQELGYAIDKITRQIDFNLTAGVPVNGEHLLFIESVRTLWRNMLSV